MNFGVEESVADQRVIQSSGEDEYAMVQGLTTASLPIVFEDPQYESRRIDAFDPYSIYAAVNAERIPDEKCRQAIGVALDRDALLLAAGGTYAGTYADGVVKPNIGIDYAPTELWDGLLGQPGGRHRRPGVRQEAPGRRRELPDRDHSRLRPE